MAIKKEVFLKKIIIGSLKRFVLLSCLLTVMLVTVAEDANACRTDKCRTDWGHREGGAFVGASTVAIFNSLNGPNHPFKTGVEALALSIAISAITEATVGAHGMKPSGKDFSQWAQGNIFGVATNLFILEYKF